MSRVINTNSPGKVRNQNRRTVAELIRRLGTKESVDIEAKDMAAQIVFSLRQIYASADEAAKAWEKRGYWMKADRFLREWEWSAEMADNVDDILRNDAWDVMPRLLSELAPYMADLQIRSLVRPASTWQGAYRRLMAEAASEQAR